jgi:hypothetical protein
MVRERRYDEALTLYHLALLQDPGNISIRYDVGQLYERLKLYPDALFTYMDLVDQIFPIGAAGRPHCRTDSKPNRATEPTWWPEEENKDPFVIRYRYIIVLGLGAPLARELVAPDWPALRDWIAQGASQYVDPKLQKKREERPWRATELVEIRRLLFARFHSIYSSYCNTHGIHVALADLLQESRIQELERYLLLCAECKASMLVDDFKDMEARSTLRGIRRRRRSFLTLTAVQQALLMIRYRLKRLDAQSADMVSRPWPYKLEEIEKDLRNEAKYSAEESTDWLEHYNAACHYALAIVEDTEEVVGNEEYAFEAVAALDRATQCGDVVEFVTSKRYWLQAGDPDLAGLRCYNCFRAFETRVYGHPLPATAEISKYELYLYLRAVLQRAAQHLEQEWRTRATRKHPRVTNAEFEEWWRQELHAWELAIRLGRFHRQWQTRRAALEGLRNWIESFGTEAQPIAYPNISRGDYLPDIGDYTIVQQTLHETEKIFTFLGSNCGNLVASSDSNKTSSSSVIDNTRRWNEYAAACSRSTGERPMSRKEAVDACVARSAVWAALRQWAYSPSEERCAQFEQTIGTLTIPPVEQQ